MPRLAARSLADISLAEEAYQADFQIADKYQGFSSELVRLSLLGIAGYGFLFAQLPPESAAAAFLGELKRSLPLLTTGIICLGVASGAALAHRFFSTDCLTHQVTILRLLRRGENAEYTSEEKVENTTLLETERRDQQADLRRCRLLIVASAAFLFAGAGIAVAAFARAVSAL
jgi:hypothetical protein